MSKNKEVEFQNSYLEVKRVFLEIAKSCKNKDATKLKKLNISHHITELINAFNNPVNINQKNYDLIIDLYGFLKPLWYELMDAFQDIKDKDYDLLIDPIVLELRSCRDYFYDFHFEYRKDFEQEYTLLKSISILDADTNETPQEIKETTSNEIENGGLFVVENGTKNTVLKEYKESLLRGLFYHRGNIEIYNKLKNRFKNEDIVLNTKFKDNQAKEQILNLAIFDFLQDTYFPILEAIYLFQNEPFECVDFTKRALKYNEYSLAEFIKSLLVIGLEDKVRFEERSNNIEYIITELKNYSCHNLPNEPDIKCGYYKFFRGEELYPAELKLKAHIASRGFTETKAMKVRKFVEENYKEVLKELQKDKSEQNNPSQNISKTSISNEVDNTTQNDNEDETTLEEKKSETKKNQPETNQTNRTRNAIDEQFVLLDNDKGWKYAFKNESDYKLFTDLLVNLFIGKNYALPKDAIKLQRGCKTRLAATLGKIQGELSNCDKLINDEDFFKIVKVLSHYKNLTNDQLYKDLTRFGKD